MATAPIPNPAGKLEVIVCPGMAPEVYLDGKPLAVSEILVTHKEPVYTINSYEPAAYVPYKQDYLTPLPPLPPIPDKWYPATYSGSPFPGKYAEGGVLGKPTPLPPPKLDLIDTANPFTKALDAWETGKADWTQGTYHTKGK